MSWALLILIVVIASFVLVLPVSVFIIFQVDEILFLELQSNLVLQEQLASVTLLDSDLRRAL